MVRDSNFDPNTQVPEYVTGETGKVNMNWSVPTISAGKMNKMDTTENQK